MIYYYYIFYLIFKKKKKKILITKYRTTNEAININEYATNLYANCLFKQPLCTRQNGTINLTIRLILIT